jgi:DNA-binding response OmpR family regulator
MIVDDSEMLQNRLKKALIKADDNFCVAQAYSCREAVEYFRAFQPVTIILDIALPDGSGIDLLQTFKKEHPGVVIAMLTNYPTYEFKEKCLALGANYFFDKSNIVELVQSIR